jgi:plastocyanin
MLNNLLVKSSVLFVAVLVVVCGASTARAEEWGSIKGRIVIDGTAPKPAPIAVTKDQFCIDKKPESDALVVGKDNALVNAVVYLRVGAGSPKVAINPEYEAKFKEPVELDNTGCMFHPHITTVRVGQTLNVKSTDPVGHNTNIGFLSFNQTIPTNEMLPIKVTKAEAVPQPVVCNIHPWMKGYVVAQDHPYMAVTGEDGTFEIKDIPVGPHEFQFWHETGYLKNVALKGGTTDNRGRAKLKIEAGKTLDLGDIKIKASNLKL